jgi:hypothetical protein
MNKKEKPMMVVWDEVNGYDAQSKSYPTNIGAPKFDLPNVPMFKTQSSKKMIDVFERERNEIIDKIKNLYDEYNTSIMVWESNMSFEPIVGNTYHLYEFKSGKTLSLLSPNEWNKHDCFLGSFVLNSDNKWIKI